MALTATAEAVASRMNIEGTKFCFTRIKDMSRMAFVDANNELICGGHAHKAERVALAVRLVRLHMLLEPTPEEWDGLLPHMGYSETSDVFAPIDSLTAADVQVEYKTGTVSTYTDGKVDKAIIRGTQGLSPVSLELQWMFQDVTTATAWSATDLAYNAPYEFTSGTLSLASNSYLFNSFVWQRDNQLRARFNNSAVATNIANTARIIHFGVNTPLSSANDVSIFTTAIAQATRLAGIAGSLAFTRGDQSMTLALGNLKWEAKAPDIDKKDAEIRNMAFWKAYESGQSGSVTDDCTITNVLSA